jgi:phosphoribosyl 1,2-cyclic phosphodiesterase
MKVISLQSGSNGNCIYVETAGQKLLFDAGISGVAAQRRLESHGIDIRRVDAVFISHDHSDHSRCAGVFLRKFGLPIFATKETLRAAQSWQQLGKMDGVRHFEAGATIELGDLAVQTVPTPHDAADGVAFVIHSHGRRLGILTDLGHVFDGLEDLIATLDAVVLESNYDVRMLRDGPYPATLKTRIAGPGGHISNIESAQLLARSGRGLKWACLAHLSEENNHPELALATNRDTAPAHLPLMVASRYEASGVMTV